MKCKFLGEILSEGDHEPIHQCDGGFQTCTVNDAGLTKSGKPLAVCETCLVRQVAVPVSNLIDMAVVIGLTRRTDRREQCAVEFRRSWPFVKPTFLPAYESLNPPDGFTAGQAAWNCGRSHLRAISEAISAGVKTLIVMEDDICLSDDFPLRAPQFLADLPDGWDMAWLGGEHRQAPFSVKPGVVRSLSTDRLHCYALSQSGMIKLNNILMDWNQGHVDWTINARLHELESYAATPWLAGQRGGQSDINGQNKPTEWFHAIKPPGEGARFKSPFQKHFVITMPQHADRLKLFFERLPKCFPKPEIWQGVYGDKVGHPDNWNAGGGAWGCYRSHHSLLEHCFNNDYESYCVFEDDAMFCDDFERRFEAYVTNLMPDWQQAYLGGQLLGEVAHPPTPINAEVLVPFNVNRTHAFAMHSRGYKTLYKHWSTLPFATNSDGSPSHIDHHVGHLQESGGIVTAVPSRWLCGQSAGRSSISGNQTNDTWWPDPIDVYKANAHPSPPMITSAVPVHVYPGVGTEVSAILHSIGIPPENCGPCRELMHKMDQWGVSGCQFHREEILDRLRMKASEIDLAGKIKLGIGAFMSGLWRKVSPIDPAAGILDEAIRIVSEREASHLIYHLWPKSTSDRWQWNVDQLLKRINQFDGTRTIGVVTSEDSKSLDDVKAAFGEHRIDNWIHLPNDGHLGEVVTFKRMLETLPQTGRTFYGHGKGVKYDDNGGWRWPELMYHLCLDNPQKVRQMIREYPMVGSFIQTGYWNGVPNWYFSGSFYWFRNDAVFANPKWKEVEQNRWGTELWPRMLFHEHEAYDLCRIKVGRLYEEEETRKVDLWLEETAPKKQPAVMEDRVRRMLMESL